MHREERNLKRTAAEHGFRVLGREKRGRYRLQHEDSGRTCLTVPCAESYHRAKPILLLQLRRVAAGLVR